MISNATFQKKFGDYLVEMDSHDCKTLHPDKAQQLKGKFYSVKTEKDLKTFASRLGVEKLTNVKL